MSPALVDALATASELVDALPDGLALVSREGRFLFVNREMRVLTGYSDAEFAKLVVEDLVPATARAVHRRNRGEYLQRPRVRPMGSDLRIVMRLKNGAEMPVDISLGPLEDGSAVVAVIRDATRREIGEHARRRDAVMSDRARVARRLQAEVITQLFAVGLAVQNLAISEAQVVRRQPLDDAITALDRVIHELREIVFTYTDPYGA